MDNRLVLGRVHILEWLNPGDDDTGRKLFEELQPMGAAFDPKVQVDFHRVDTARELLVFTEQSGERLGNGPISQTDLGLKDV
jgi:hypothetical protein